MDTKEKVELTLKVPFKSNNYAEYAKNSLAADLNSTDSKILYKLSTQDDSPKLLRASVNSTFDLLILISNTIEAFA
ncbi:hypothetical protein BB561_005180 [Smittium simulii]|uniref:Transcription factor Pcc1 n=1 Tax=Smittium simulii TaxID=133385 RepID=A0A2T9YBM3_9FUNG|nr:hypothetical protein BB561_005180 [Smittium simulii]